MAEDVCDPLDGLVEKAAIDPGRPLRPMRWWLAALKKDDRAVRGVAGAVEESGCDGVDEAIAEENGETAGAPDAGGYPDRAQSAERFTP
jgi:hypothetical protein